MKFENILKTSGIKLKSLASIASKKKHNRPNVQSVRRLAVQFTLEIPVVELRLK